MRKRLPTAALVLTTCSLAADAAETITYTYDALGRLVTVVHTGTVNNNVQATYTLDPAGNRTNLTVIKP